MTETTAVGDLPECVCLQYGLITCPMLLLQDEVGVETDEDCKVVVPSI